MKKNMGFTFANAASASASSSGSSSNSSSASSSKDKKKRDDEMDDVSGNNQYASSSSSLSMAHSSSSKAVSSSSSSSSSSSAMSHSKIKRPNILISGTPGTGKTTTSELVAMYLNDSLGGGFTHVNLSELVQEKGLHDGYDAKYDSYMINDDKVCDELEDYMQKGGVVLDTHSLIDYFPERWFQLVVVLQTDNTVLYDRLLARKYSPAKIAENVECEIMMVIAQEAQESYTEIPVQLLESNTTEQLESNVSRICQWAQAWIKNNNE